MFVSLHTHSDGSPQDGAQTIETIVKAVKSYGQNAVALTDHGRCGGLLQLKQVCEKNEIKPIYGLEAYVAPTSRYLKEKVEDHKTSYHLTLLAQNEVGLGNIIQLCSQAWIEGFYYKPRLDMDLLTELSEGVIALSGCSSGRVCQMFLNDRPEEAEQHLLALRDIFKDRLYVEVQNHGIDWQMPLKKYLFGMSEKFSIPIVATQDAHYSKKEDADLHKYICKIAAGDLSFECTENYLKTEDQMEFMFEPSEYHAIKRTQEVADRCNCNWETGKTIWPVYTKNDDPFRLLSTLAKNKLYMMFNRNVPQEYSQRLEYELGVIKQMGFATYFLVVQDFINWAKRNGVGVGFGRGSAAGSIICYALGITGVDPIKYGLYFERFLNPSRVSLPDCDTDFDPIGRKRVLDYVKSKYGEEKVSQIGTYAVFKPRGALRDFARAMEYGYEIGDKLAAMIPPAVSGIGLSFDECIKAEPKLLKTEYPELVNMARRAQGLKKQAGVHAAGVVISSSDIRRQVPLFLGNHHEITTQFDMHDVEDYGLVKYDFLGLKNLAVIRDTIELVKKYHGVEIDVSKIDVEDQNVYQDIFQKGRLDGVFQFETSSGLRDLCMRAQPKSIEDLSALVALFRPGPLATGLVDKYISVRNGEEPEYLIPQLEPILEETAGVYCYQEQIMRICTDVAGYTLSEADNMRRIIGKKQVDKMKVERDKFVKGCLSMEVNESAANKMFDDISGFAAYSFNKTVDKNTLIDTIDGEKRIEDCLPGDTVFSISKNGEVEESKIVTLHDHGVVPIWEVEFNDGTIEKCTLDHKWLTSSGQIPISQIAREGISVWGAAREVRGSISSSIAMSNMQRSISFKTRRRRQSNLVGMQRLQKNIWKQTKPDATSSSLRGIQKDSNKRASLKERDENALWCNCAWSSREKESLPILFDMPREEKRDSEGNLRKNRSCEVQRDLLNKCEENISSCGYNREEISYIEAVERRASRKVFRDKRSGSSLFEKIKSRNVCRAVSERSWLREKLSDKMWRRKKTSRLCLHPKENCYRDRWALALLSNKRRRISGSCSKAGSYVGDRDAEKRRLEANTNIHRHVSAKNGRAKISNGRPCAHNKGEGSNWDLNYRKVVRATYVGLCQGYDLEVSHPEHNYLLASGLCCSNSHSVAYSFTSYHTAWLKRYYPHEFYTALLNSSLDNQTDIIKYMYAANEDGITVLPPDINHSDTKFSLDNETILFGLVGIKSVGEKACEALINGRPKSGFKDLVEFLRSGLVNSGVVRALAESGALTSLGEMSRGAIVSNIANLLEYHQKMKDYEEKEILVAEREAKRLEAITEGKKPPAKLRLKEKPEPFVLDDGRSISKLDLLAMERKTLGSYVTGHPLDSFPSLSSRSRVTIRNIIDGDVEDRSLIMLPVVISSIVEKRTRKGKNMAVLQIEDKTGRIEATVFNKVWLDIKDKIQEDMVVMTSCMIERQTVGDGEDEQTIVRATLRNIGSTNFKPEVAEVLCFKLEDGTTVEFIPVANVDMLLWKQGKQLISSLRRT